MIPSSLYEIPTSQATSLYQESAQFQMLGRWCLPRYSVRRYAIKRRILAGQLSWTRLGSMELGTYIQERSENIYDKRSRINFTNTSFSRSVSPIIYYFAFVFKGFIYTRRTRIERAFLSIWLAGCRPKGVRLHNICQRNGKKVCKPLRTYKRNVGWPVFCP